MTMLLKFDNPKLFSEVISIISDLVLEVRIRVTKEGLSISAIDPASVAMIVFKLPSTAFSQWDLEQDELLGVSLESLKAVLRRVKSGSVLTLAREENELRVVIQDKIRREFNLALIDVEGEEKPIPQLEFASKIEMNSLDFSEVIEDCSVVADACSFITKASKFVIHAKGSLNSFRSEFGDEINITAEESKSKYSLEYLQKMIKATRLSDTTVINFSTDYPLRLDFKAQLMELSFILAPRVENEN